MINRLFEKLLQENEQIDYVVHKHWISLVYPFSKSLLLGVIAPTLLIWLYSNDLYLALAGVVWLLSGLIWLIYIFLDWHYDVFLVTDQHLIEIEWEGFFKRKTNRIRYTNIDNISYDAKGILSSIFGFADLSIITYAGEKKDLKDAAKAKEVQDLLMQRCEDESDEEENKINKEDLKKALKSLLQEELMNDEELVEAAADEKEHEIVVMEQRKIKKK